jgi:Carboxypeptidase regulatory-like domain
MCPVNLMLILFRPNEAARNLLPLFAVQCFMRDRTKCLGRKRQRFQTTQARGLCRAGLRLRALPGLKTICLVLAFSSCLAAQPRTGGLTGHVAGSRAEALPGVVVAAIAEDGDVKFAITDRKGCYAISPLPAGSYIIWAGGGGFPLYENTHFALRGGRSRILNIRLRPGSSKPPATRFEMVARR